MDNNKPVERPAATVAADWEEFSDRFCKGITSDEHVATMKYAFYWGAMMMVDKMLDVINSNTTKGTVDNSGVKVDLEEVMGKTALLLSEAENYFAEVEGEGVRNLVNIH